uniref:Uncharacterized protein n=1 Tax=Rhizophora mucronata TaxID=61149 RepID=A0A2P2N6J9_RHIMU
MNYHNKIEVWLLTLIDSKQVSANFLWSKSASQKVTHRRVLNELG